MQTIHSPISSVAMPDDVGGSWPVMLTPFDDRRRIDWDAFEPLAEWYIAGGSQGLFAACLSSEIFQLTLAERLDLARRTVDLTAGRIPVIASGFFGNTPREITDAANRFVDTGVQAIIFLSNQFAEQTESDDAWLAAAEATLRGIDSSINVGIYECPIPYKRILSPRLTHWAAQTGRFHFIKDTCCDLEQIKAKLSAIADSPLRFYNANTATLLPSLQAGGHGFSGCGANFIPHLYAWMCKNYAVQPQVAAELQDFLDESNAVVDHKYPHSARAWLQLCGLPITPTSRLFENNIDACDVERLRVFQTAVREWEERLGLSSPFESVVPSGNVA